jgi:biotin transport system substrate-specific component
MAVCLKIQRRIGFQGEGVDVRKVLLSIVLFVISSKIAIPFYPVPLTAQMLAVYSLGLALRPMEAFATTSGLVLMGLAGFPVFATSNSLYGPSAGYIIGMLIATPAVGVVLRASGSRLLACVCAYFVVHIMGCLRLASFIGWESVMPCGVYPFVVAEAIKIAVACGLYRAPRTQR